MSLPKAAMNEDYGPVFRQSDVGFAGDIPTVQAVPKSSCVQGFPNFDLGASIPRPNT